MTPAPTTISCRRRRARVGFTILELLAAMLILTLLTVMIFSAFEQGRRGWSGATARARAYEDARRAVEMIGADLGSATIGPGLRFVGQSSKLQFVAPVSASEGWRFSTTAAWVTNDLVDLAWVSYEFVADPPVGHLVRKYAPPLSRYNVSSSPLLLDSLWQDHVDGSSESGNTNYFAVLVTNAVIRCQFWYFDGTNASPNWTPTDRLPRSVRIRIETVDEQTAKQLRLGGDSALLLTSAVRVVETQIYLQNSR